MQPPARCSNHRCVYIDQCGHQTAIYTSGFSCFIIQGRNIIQAPTENISNSEKMQRACATTLIFIFQNLRIFINQKTVYTVSHLIHSLKKFYHFEIISLAISIAFLYLFLHISESAFNYKLRISFI